MNRIQTVLFLMWMIGIPIVIWLFRFGDISACQTFCHGLLRGCEIPSSCYYWIAGPTTAIFIGAVMVSITAYYKGFIDEEQVRK